MRGERHRAKRDVEGVRGSGQVRLEHLGELGHRERDPLGLAAAGDARLKRSREGREVPLSAQRLLESNGLDLVLRRYLQR